MAIYIYDIIVGITFMRPEGRQGHNPPRCSSQPLRSRQPAYITVYWSIAKVALQNIQPTSQYWSIATTK